MLPPLCLLFHHPVNVSYFMDDTIRPPSLVTARQAKACFARDSLCYRTLLESRKPGKQLRAETLMFQRMDSSNFRRVFRGGQLGAHLLVGADRAHAQEGEDNSIDIPRQVPTEENEIYIGRTEE